MNATVLPEVTTKRCVGIDISMDVMGLGKARLVVSFLVRRSHHLIGLVQSLSVQ